MSRGTLWKCVTVLLPVATIGIVSSRESRAQTVVVEGPPSAYIASYEPVYYNGFAHYLYRDHWAYRDHGAWRGYRHEPGFLHDHRGEWAHHAHHWR
jgi:hypothetical protein